MFHWGSRGNKTHCCTRGQSLSSYCLLSIRPLGYRNIFRDEYYPSGYFPCYASYKNIKFPRGNCQIFLRTLAQKSFRIIPNFFIWKSWQSNVKFEKENRQKYSKPAAPLYREILTDEYFSRTGSISTSVSSRTNTFASRDQFKPIRIGENLVVSYKDWWFFSADELLRYIINFNQKCCR